jgi:hypothetical protein
MNEIKAAGHFGWASLHVKRVAAGIADVKERESNLPFQRQLRRQCQFPVK